MWVGRCNCSGCFACGGSLDVTKESFGFVSYARFSVCKFSHNNPFLFHRLVLASQETALLTGHHMFNQEWLIAAIAGILKVEQILYISEAECVLKSVIDSSVLLRYCGRAISQASDSFAVSRLFWRVKSPKNTCQRKASSSVVHSCCIMVANWCTIMVANWCTWEQCALRENGAVSTRLSTRRAIADTDASKK